MRRRRTLGLMLAALVATGCGGSGAREQVDTYVKRVNAVQADAAPALAEADRSYGKVVRRKLGDPTVVPQLVAAEKTIRETQARVARIPAPPPARRLREQLLRLYELNAGLARETVLLGRYVPERRKVLERVARANRGMSRAIARANQPRAQAATFAAYRDRLDSAITALERLQPPPVSAAAHDQQLRRLRASRRLAGSLRRAVLARDPAGPHGSSSRSARSEASAPANGRFKRGSSWTTPSAVARSRARSPPSGANGPGSTAEASSSRVAAGGHRLRPTRSSRPGIAPALGRPRARAGHAACAPLSDRPPGAAR